MQVGDSIALKKMLGPGESEIEILGNGTITSVNVSNTVKCEVDWVAKNLNRVVPSRGCYDSVRRFNPDESEKAMQKGDLSEGDLEDEEEWLENVFHEVLN